jgi:hypothetical protein
MLYWNNHAAGTVSVCHQQWLNQKRGEQFASSILVGNGACSSSINGQIAARFTFRANQNL